MQPTKWTKTPDVKGWEHFMCREAAAADVAGADYRWPCRCRPPLWPVPTSGADQCAGFIDPPPAMRLLWLGGAESQKGRRPTIWDTYMLDQRRETKNPVRVLNTKRSSLYQHLSKLLACLFGTSASSYFPQASKHKKAECTKQIDRLNYMIILPTPKSPGSSQLTNIACRISTSHK